MRREGTELNLAFVDGQNLHLGTTENGWKIDHKKFRTYYFLGYVTEEQQDLYNNLQKAGFIVLFKEHSSALKGKKIGQVHYKTYLQLKTFIHRGFFSLK